VAGTAVRLTNCHNFHDFRELARRRLPGPIFNYIDAAGTMALFERPKILEVSCAPAGEALSRSSGSRPMSASSLSSKCAML
jgi:L-lactate dehydrogenase (cytochrome)